MVRLRNTARRLTYFSVSLEHKSVFSTMNIQSKCSNSVSHR